MVVGAIGARSLRDVIVFEVSSRRVLTFNDLSRRNTTRFADHNTLLRKPISQFVGPELDNMDLSIILHSHLGVNPQAEFNKLIQIQRSGQVVTFIVGRQVLGVFRWRIENLGIPYDRIDPDGFCRSSEVSLSLREYAR